MDDHAKSVLILWDPLQTTEYNLRNFGFKSKKDWKRSKINDSE